MGVQLIGVLEKVVFIEFCQGGGGLGCVLIDGFLGGLLVVQL